MLAFVRSSGYIYVANGVLNITTIQSHVASGGYSADACIRKNICLKL